MKTMTVCVEGNSLIALDTDAANFLRELGEPVTRRASHVEPANKLLRVLFYTCRLFGDKCLLAEFTRQWPCLWRINMSPVGGPVLPDLYRNRKEAIEVEIEYFNQHIAEVR